MASSWQRHQSTGGEPRRFLIAGLSAEAGAALGSMLRLLEARLARQWRQIDQGRADVLFLGAGIDAQRESALVAQVTRVVRVASYDCEHPGAALRLEYPFRVFQVLSVLHEIDQQLEIDSAGDAPLDPQHLGAGDNSLLSSLQAQANRNSHGLWLAARYADGRVLYLRDDLSDFAADDGVHADVMEGRLPPGPFVPAAAPATHLRHASGSALIWRIGLASAGGRLSPSLDPEGRYHLREWPDFGLIRPHRLHLRMAALMAARPYTRQELADALESHCIDDVTRFFNAAQASGLLHLVQAGIKRKPNAPGLEPSSFIVGLVSRIRGRLGLAGQNRLSV